MNIALWYKFPIILPLTFPPPPPFLLLATNLADPPPKTSTYAVAFLSVLYLLPKNSQSVTSMWVKWKWQCDTIEPLLSEPFFKVEIAIGKLKRYKSSGNNQILPEFIQARDKALCSEFHTLIGIRENYHSSRRNLLLYLFIKEGNKTKFWLSRNNHCQLCTNFYPKFFSQS
jgi:hypothetical protein